jgi:hypothetical protein
LTALAVFLWPKKEWSVEPEKLFALVAALAAWVGSLIPDRGPTAHDVELFDKFQAVMSPEWINWLRRHDFGGSFGTNRTQPLLDIDGDWEGPAFMFDDPILQTKFDPLVAKICEFTRLVAHNTWPIHGAKMQTACPNGEPVYEDEPHVWARVQKLNDAGTVLVTAIDGFMLLGRKRLGRPASIK